MLIDRAAPHLEHALVVGPIRARGAAAHVPVGDTAAQPALRERRRHLVVDRADARRERPNDARRDRQHD